MPNKHLLRVIIIDTAGQERYRSLGRMYYKQADGILLVFDITNKKTFEELTNYYLDEIRNNCKINVPLILLGNKLDLEEKREVPSREALTFALKNKYLYFETSCKNNINIIESFELLIEYCYKETLNKKKNIEKINSYSSYNKNNNLGNKLPDYNNKSNNNLGVNYYLANKNYNYINNANNNLRDINFNLNNNNSKNNNNEDKNENFSLSLKNQKNSKKSSSCC